jgi:hypothetical protein
MQQLIDALLDKGFTPEQAQAAVSTIVDWVKENYPIAGGAVAAWFKSEKV